MHTVKEAAVVLDIAAGFRLADDEHGPGVVRSVCQACAHDWDPFVPAHLWDTPRLWTSRGELCLDLGAEPWRPRPAAAKIGHSRPGREGASPLATGRRPRRPDQRARQDRRDDGSRAELRREDVLSPAAGVRLVSDAGGAVGLIPTPSLAPVRAEVLLDVELVDPDRLVRLLARAVAREDLRLLAAACAEMADVIDRDLEHGAPVATLAVRFGDTGITVRLLRSEADLAELEVQVLDEDGELDGVAIEIRPAALRRAGRELEDLAR